MPIKTLLEEHNMTDQTKAPNVQGSTLDVDPNSL